MEKRRSFLKNIALLGTAISAPAAVFAVEKSTTVAPGQTSIPGKQRSIRGTVKQQGTGISNVFVTDGFTIVSTNKTGDFEFEADPRAEFIYLTIPAGYEFNHEAGIAQFYRPIQSADFNFQLKKLTRNDHDHVFVVWADPQVQTDADAQNIVNEAGPDLAKLTASYPENTLIHGICAGDIVWDQFRLFKDYKTSISKSNIPFFQVIGNHDMDLDVRTDDLSAKTFKQHFGPSYYAYNRGKIHYVALDDVFFLGTGRRYIGYLTEQQLHWLEQDLSHVAPGTTVVLTLHIPTNTGQKRRYELKEDDIANVVANREQLYKLLKPYQTYILSGHTHFNEHIIEENIHEIVHGAICGAWWSGPVCYDGTPKGYGVYEVKGNQISWYYKSIGKAKEHQIRVYDRNNLSKPGYVVANVWNWDPSWKISWAEDGVIKGEMKQFSGKDPLTIELYEGNIKPVEQPWVEPILTDHLFFVSPSANAKQIEVIATDRFGTIYKEKLAIL